MRGFFLRNAFLLSLGLFIGFAPLYTYAEEEVLPSCGTIIYSAEESYPLQNCDNPFELVTPNENLSVSFGNTPLEDGGSYTLLNTTGTFELTGTHPDAFFVETALYKKEGNNYRYIPLNVSEYTFVETGTYTLVVTEDPKPERVMNTFEKLFDFIIPTAYAFPGTSLVRTFEIVEATEKPPGISNILFLPGIQASRLYTKDADGDEEKLWEPGGDDDVLRLAMTGTGESIEHIYAKEVIDKIFLSGSIYKDFLEFLGGLGSNHLKPTIGVFPYDWRDDVFDVVEKGIPNNDGSYIQTVEAIEYLATTSITGKVTLIAHSNGGLLAKAIMRKLEDEGKSNLVDKIIFIAVPHSGTPKGIMALLHGYDQGHALGLVSTEEGVRKVMKNMPGVYGLLPSEKYMSTLSEPLISFDDSSLTESYRNAYGFTVGTMDEYMRFLKGSEGRVYTDNQVNEPSTANGEMLEKALQKHRDELDTWEAPRGVEVFNVIGTGLPTPNSIEYKGFEDITCAGSVCKQIQKIEPVIHFTNYGDGTVVSKSANLITNNNYHIDLSAVEGYKHADITESDTTQDVVNHILHGSSTQGIDFVTDTEQTFSNNTDVITIHSPARIFVQDTKGNITGKTETDGVWQSKIPGSDYFEAGGVKYVLVPSEGTYSIIIEGEGIGVFTHEIKKLKGNIEEPQHHLTATVTPLAVAKYTLKNGATSNIILDIDGDGKIDTAMTPDGVSVPKPATYDDLYNALGTLSSTTTQAKTVLGLARQAEKYSGGDTRVDYAAERMTLLIMKTKIETLQKSGLVSKEIRQSISQIITELIKK